MTLAISRTRTLLLNVEGVLLHFTLLVLDFSPVVNGDVFVRVLLVYLGQMLLSQVQDLVSDVSNVSFFGSLFDLVADHGILFEDFLEQELFFKLHGFHILLGGVDKFTFFVEANVVIAYVGVLMELNGRIRWILT